MNTFSKYTKFIIFDFRKSLNLGDFITIIDLAEKYYRLTNKNPYIITRGKFKNNAVKQIITEYKFIKFIELGTFFGFLETIYILFLSIFTRYSYCISITGNKIKKIFIIFLYYFTRSNLLLFSFSDDYFKIKSSFSFLKENENTKIVINHKLNFLNINNLLLSSLLSKEIIIEQKFLYKKNNFVAENYLNKNEYIGLALGASNLGKSVKIDDFLYIAKSFWEKYKKEFIFLGVGSKYELMVAEQLILMFKENNIPYKNFLGEKDFYNTLNLLNGSFINIGPNTGLILLSFYMNNKTLVFSENTSNFYTFKNENSQFLMNPKMCTCPKILHNVNEENIKINEVGCCVSLIDIRHEVDNYLSTM